MDDIKEITEQLSVERDSHPINDRYIDYGQRLGFFPVFEEQLKDDAFKEMQSSWKMYYFLLQSEYNLRDKSFYNEDSSGDFYERDAKFAAMLNVSLKSNNISKARKKFIEKNWIDANPGTLTRGGQRKATEYTYVRWAMPTQEKKTWAKVDRATFLYLLKKLRDKPRFHDVLVVWIGLLFICLSKKTAWGGVRGVNSFTLNKKDIADYANQSQPKIKKALDALKELGFIQSWFEPKLNSYHIEHFTLYGHQRKGGYSYGEEVWFEKVQPISKFLDEVELEGAERSQEKARKQAEGTLEKHHDVFEIYSRCFQAVYKDNPTFESEETRIMQLKSLINKIGANTVKKDIVNYFKEIDRTSIKEKASISGLYRYSQRIHFQKKIKPKKDIHFESRYDITDDDLPF